MVVIESLSTLQNICTIKSTIMTTFFVTGKIVKHNPLILHIRLSDASSFIYSMSEKDQIFPNQIYFRLYKTSFKAICNLIL